MVKINVEISIEDESWNKVDFNLKSTIKMACLNTLKHLKTFSEDKKQGLSTDKKICEISVLLTNDEHIKKLNKQYRDKNRETNVLSFPIVKNIKKELEKSEFCTLGDIILSFETLEREAKAQKKSLKDHLTHLVIHSMLHLLGYKHSNNTEAEVMEREEVQILKQIGISSPYK